SRRAGAGQGCGRASRRRQVAGRGREREGSRAERGERGGSRGAGWVVGAWCMVWCTSQALAGHGWRRRGYRAFVGAVRVFAEEKQMMSLNQRSLRGLDVVTSCHRIGDDEPAPAAANGNEVDNDVVVEEF